MTKLPEHSGAHLVLTFDPIRTVEHGPTELRGGGQREAGVVELVAVVTDADLKLDRILDVLKERGRVERYEERKLPLPQKLLEDTEERERFGLRLFLCQDRSSAALPPPPPAGRLQGRRQISAPACPPASWSVRAELFHGTPRLPPDNKLNI